MRRVIEEVRGSRAIRCGLWAGMAVLVLLGVTNLSLVVMRTLIPPYKITSYELLTPQIKPGGELRVNYQGERRRICRADLDRFILRTSDHAVIWRERVPGGSVGIGKWPDLVQVILTPPNLSPGKYELQIIVLNECPEGSYAEALEGIYFEVVP